MTRTRSKPHTPHEDYSAALNPSLVGITGATVRDFQSRSSRRLVTIRPDLAGWFEVRFTFRGADFKAQALLFDTPSDYGVDRGRVSKLAIDSLGDFKAVIGDPDTQTRTRTAIYNYDRGLDFDRAPAGLVTALVAFLEGR